MHVMTATNLRKELFGVLEKALQATPTKIHYKKGDAIVVSYQQYQALKRARKGMKKGKGLRALVPGKIRKPLNEKAGEELMQYMGLA